MTRPSFEVKPFPWERHDIVDSLEDGVRRHKPGVVDERVEVREYLALTASIDHDIVDGARAARFAKRLRELIEGADVLREAPP